MWIFLPGGLLMPADVPMDIADPKFTEGRFNLQVRGREVAHLQDFMDNFMEPGMFHPEIQLNPGMDYNCRFYTTREAFAAAMSRAILTDLDYEKFKPTAERKNPDGTLRYGEPAKVYHSVLNSIWGTVTRLGKPGGTWGPRSESNPVGYLPAARYEYLSKGAGAHRPAGTSRWDVEDFEDELMGEDEFDGWTSSREQWVDSLLEEVSDIPADQWEDFLSPQELEMVRFAMPKQTKPNRRSRRAARREAKSKRK